MTDFTRRYAIIGTGGRSEMYLRALLTTHADLGEVVAFLDTNERRMAFYDGVARELGSAAAIRHFAPESFETMLAETVPDVLIVTSPDFTHAEYIVAGLDRGLDVVCEKPMTIDAPSLRAIVDAADRSAGNLIVTFNYRYSPRNTLVRQIIADGLIGDVTSVHFEWCLDTVHGADYFRRWHREKSKSGGLLVHKSTHHFDLVNWWIDDVPDVVFALGRLRFYGPENAARRGLGPRAELGRDLPGDPFALDLAADDKLSALFLEAESLDGYQRDRDVFSDGITIEDNMTVAVGYRSGASLAYTLVAHSPWEGYRVAISGTEGRVELEVVERGAVSHDRATSGLGPNGKSAPVVDPSAQVDDLAQTETVRPHGSRVVLQRLWEPPRVIPIPEGVGSHGGGDRMLLDDVFRGPGEDPLRRQAGYLDGVRSVIVGVSGNESIRTGMPVRVAEFGLPLIESDGGVHGLRPKVSA
ncbi:Gfo/Idh/MocA family protein [Microbacterium sp. DT81.1]|uniref:Gfo/Idh/MocA family protein n=1 Tax=Microbacterium sp. DT81.1 TaxID=3393413 RepID=UPI003CF164D0